MYIEPKYSDEKMEVLLGHDAFPRLIEEYMGPDARKYFDYIVETFQDDIKEAYESGKEDGYDKGYDDGFADGKSDSQHMP